MCAMKSVLKVATLLVSASLALALGARAQNASGALEFVARVTPTAARPEPVRTFTFYLLAKSYADIIHEVEVSDPAPDRDQYVAALKVSQPLKDWLKKHETLDLTSSDIDQVLTPDDIMAISEFFAAYIHSNSGGVTPGFPRPKYASLDSKKEPEKYERLHQQYLDAIRRFVTANPASMSGMEVQLDTINPQRRWTQLQSEHRRRLEHRAPEIARTRYLVAKVDTDLDGHGSFANVPAGSYWLSTLNLDAAAGDVRLRWDVPVTVRPGETARFELTDLNAVESQGSSP
jgi:hypothetical protein